MLLLLLLLLGASQLPPPGQLPVKDALPGATNVTRVEPTLMCGGATTGAIHCASANRVGALWLIKRVVVDGWDVERATTEARAIGLTSDELRTRAVEYATSHRR